MNTHLYLYVFVLLHLFFFHASTKNSSSSHSKNIVHAGKKPSSLRQVWETDTLLRTPESVLYEPIENVLYVSNINGNGAVKDENGFISKVSLEGQILTLQWVTGLNAPKGMGISGNKLFVADIDRLVMFDLGSGAQLKSYNVAEPVYLNDITIAENGIVYVSDNRNDKIYYLRNDSLQIFMEGENLQRPNGLYIEGNKLAVGSQKNNALQIIDLDSKKITRITDGLGASDGVESAGKGAYFFSDWNGRVFWISSKGEKKLLLNTTAAKVNSADIEYIANKKMLFVPTFNGNTVVAYRVR
jgi:DNA-binding beta-propeller fold protein YncE